MCASLGVACIVRKAGCFLSTFSYPLHNLRCFAFSLIFLPRIDTEFSLFRNPTQLVSYRETIDLENINYRLWFLRCRTRKLPRTAHNLIQPHLCFYFYQTTFSASLIRSFFDLWSDSFWFIFSSLLHIPNISTPSQSTVELLSAFSRLIPVCRTTIFLSVSVIHFLSSRTLPEFQWNYSSHGWTLLASCSRTLSMS